MTAIQSSAIPAPESAIADIAARLQGRLVRPTDSEYETVRRVWNGMIDRRPSFVARVASTADVATVVAFAADHDQPLSICGGGHNVAGSAVIDGAIMLDMREMRAVSVDPDTRIVVAQGGATWADVDQKSSRFGLAVPGGVVSDTGIAGLTLGGGFGLLSRKYGLSCDNVISFEVVAAGGEVLRAAADENADLFWALRGGGGNFGVVTSFEYRAHQVGSEIPVCFVAHPVSAAREALALARDYMASAPDDLMGIAFFGAVPDEGDAFPAEIRGQEFIGFLAGWLGDHAEADEAFAPLRTLATPLFDMTGIYPWTEAQSMLDEDYPAGLRYFWKSSYIERLDDAAVDALIDLAARRPSKASTLDIWIGGGQVARLDDTATAFTNRGFPFHVGIEANWEDPSDDAANIAWAREVCDVMEPFSYRGGSYLNFPGSDAESRELIRNSYGPNYQRLVDVKTKYDPGNRFRFNQNIVPHA